MSWESLTYNMTKWEHERSAEGAECVFITHAFFVGDYWFGLKVYRKASVRDSASSMHNTFANLGLAPPRGSHVKVLRSVGRGKKPVRMYGYLTGMVRTVADDVDIEWDLQHLRNRIKKAGLVMHDMRNANVGYWKGSLVCIDFGTHAKTGTGTE